MELSCLLVAALLATNPPAGDADTDRDGLSDFHEVHKHFTNPQAADSDGDGVPDGDWEERREYAYTVRALVHVVPPVTPDVLCDDYQDARILEQRDDYVELEVILYPLNTVADAIAGDPEWRAAAARPEMRKWVEPGLTANWDAEMQRGLREMLAKEGVDVDQVDDRTLVEQASKIALKHAEYQDGFTTFSSWFVDGKPQVYPGMAKPEDSTPERIREIEACWQRELFARGMFAAGQRGSCTSSAIYVNGCMRALGIPTRIVLTVPIIDASDERERGFVERIRHNQVRYAIEQGTAGLGNSWASHTFNEVYVGGRWRRLNYDRLGQNILDPGCFGLLIHVATFSDWADGRMAATWGMRQANPDRPGDPFGGSNPYSTIFLSDRFGAHANVDNPVAPGDHRQLTVDEVMWYTSAPDGVSMRLDDPETAGHVVVRVKEGVAGEGPRQYKRFYDRVGKEFVLRAADRPDVPLRATRGYWARPEEGLRHFYLRIEPDALATMALDVAYALVAKDGDGEFAWIVEDGVKLTRTRDADGTARERGAAAAATAPPADGPVREVAITSLYWSDAEDSPTGPLAGFAKPVLLARMGRSDEFDLLKQFTENADLRFYLEAEGCPTLSVGAGTGGVTTKNDSYLVIALGPADWRGLKPGVEYRLRPRNGHERLKWKLADGAVVRR